MANVVDILNDNSRNVFYETGFRNLIEEHLTYLRDNKSVETIMVEHNLRYKFEHDLYGYLTAKDYPREYHWIILRVNDFHTTSEFTKETTMLIVPNLTQVENLIKVYKTKEAFV